MRDPLDIRIGTRPAARRDAGRGDHANGARPAPEVPPGACLGFGPHLVFDAHACSFDRIDDVARIYTLLDRLPDRIGMTRIMPPYVFRHGTPGDPAEGISGFVLIAESHISVHTFLSRRFVNVDIFSCEKFDVEDAIHALREEFVPQRVDWRLFDRGSEFPRHLADSRTIVSRDRRSLARGLGLEASR